MVLSVIACPKGMEYRAKPDTPIYLLESNYAERATPKAAGFWWNPYTYKWYTGDVEKASKLIAHATPECADQIKSILTTREASVKASQATSADIDIPHPAGLDYLPYQKAGIKFGMDHPNVLLGDEMGLGKTIQAIGYINATPDIKTVLIVCPATLKGNWHAELRKWLTRPFTMMIIGSDTTWQRADITIINYDQLKKFHSLLLSREWDMLIVDEAHYIKSHKAQRTHLILGKWNRDPSEAIPALKAKRKWLLTGTPICNRPSELWTIAHALDPKTFSNWSKYMTRYCEAVQTKYGWDVKGAANLNELQRLLRQSIMIRRLKADVLTELPPKRRQIISMPADSCNSYIQAEKQAQAELETHKEALLAQMELAKASDDEAAYKTACEAMNRENIWEFTEISRVRHETALAKVPLCAEYCKELMESVGKLVIFAHHTDVIARLMQQLSSFNPVSITGQTPVDMRQEIVNQFQTDDSVRIFIGNIKAAGVGITLTAASTVVFVELDWVPGNVSQAEDRCHRIGQKDSVNVYHLVLESSIDEKLAYTIVDKQAVIDKALNGGGQNIEEATKPVAYTCECATRESTRETIAQESALLTPDQIKAIHIALRFLASHDADHASCINGVGFNKIDGRIGHSLAGQPSLSPKQAALGKKIALKYKKQLSPELITTIKGSAA